MVAAAVPWSLGAGAAVGAAILPGRPTIYLAPRRTPGENESPPISRKSVPPALVPSAAEPSATEDNPSWARLEQLRPGQKVEIALTNLSKHRGKFLVWTEEAITLRVKKRDLIIPREQVHRVRRLRKGRRGRNALIGMGVGFGALLGGVAVAPDSSDPEATAILVAFIGIPVSLGVGAAVGAAIPPGRPTIYLAPPGKPGAIQQDELAGTVLSPEDSSPASTDVMLHLSKTLRPFTTERAMEIMAATRATKLLDEDKALAARRHLYLAASPVN